MMTFGQSEKSLTYTEAIKKTTCKPEPRFKTVRRLKMKSYLKKISKKHILIVGFLCLILLIAIAFTMTHTGESKASKVRTTQTTSKSSKKKESSSSTSSTSSSTSSQSSSESTSEVQQAEAPATQTEQQPQEQQPQEQQEAPQQPVTPAQPSQEQIQQAQEQYGYTPGYGGYYPSDEEIAADQARQQWYDDQVQWGIEQGYIDPNTGDYTGQ